MDTLLIIGALIVGVLFGGWGYRFFLADQRLRKLETEMAALQKEYADYQARVSGHFERTATLANQLADNYRDMYDHLRKGAQLLSPQPITWSSRIAGAPFIEHHDIHDDIAPLPIPPKDY